jgi:hypothetical protein
MLNCGIWLYIIELIIYEDNIYLTRALSDWSDAAFKQPNRTDLFFISLM